MRIVVGVCTLLILSACVTPGTKTWPGVDPVIAEKLRDALSKECVLYTNTHNYRDTDTAEDRAPKKIIRDEIVVMDTFASPPAYIASLYYRGTGFRIHYDLEKALFSCPAEKSLRHSPTLAKYFPS